MKINSELETDFECKVTYQFKPKVCCSAESIAQKGKCEVAMIRRRKQTNKQKLLLLYIRRLLRSNVQRPSEVVIIGYIHRRGDQSIKKGETG